MVTKNSPMYSYMRNGSASAAKGSSSKSSKMKSGRYWEGSNPPDTPDREDYAHHLRSSSYQVLHSQQQLNMGPSGPHHARQASNASHCSESEDGAPRADQRTANYSSQFYGPPNVDRSRYLSYDNIGPETTSHKYQTPWNVSEPNLSGTPTHSSQNSYYPPPHHLTTSPHNSHSSYYHHHSEASNSLHSSPGVHHTSLNVQHSSSNLHSSPSNSSFNSQQQQPPPPPVRQSPPAPRRTHPSSPPPLPVRDASSLKFLKYGPGHEKFPSWPMAAGSASQGMSSGSEHDSGASGLAESLTGPQGSHRSKSWTEQSDYPKDLSGGYTRPHHKKHLSPAYQQQLKTVLEKSEKIPPQIFESKLGDDLLSDPKCALLDSIYKPDSSYYPLYDRDGHGIDDKDYNIPSPPERDPGMGEANLSQVTPAQLEEYSRHCDFSYDVGVTPFLDRLREESAAWDGSSAAWDGGSERDSGRGESESMADSFRYSNGRESVTTVVTNSSSASSSETLKWHGSLSDISIMSGHSRDARTEQNIVHSSRVLAPQRHNSESVLYYGSDKGRKQSRGLPDYRTRDGVRISRENDPSISRGSRETRWNREVERNNEVNNLKKFPSYSYTQPLSQINEAPGAESHETNVSNQSTKSPTIDISKPPSVAERIHELERQSRNPQRDQSRFRDASEPRERTGSRDGQSAREVRRRDLSEPRGEFRDEQDNTLESRSSNSADLGRPATETNQSPFNSEQLEQRSDLRGDRSLSTIGNSNEHNLSTNPVSKVPVRNSADLPAQDQENLHSQYNHNDREKIAPLKNFAYLDPKKQCKVPDSTLKNIQKQALMSFYERRTGIKSTSASSLTSNKPPSPLVSKNSFSSSRSGSNIREDRSGLAGISLARLGRVPDSDCAESPSRPPRKRSVNGRSDLKEDGPLRPGGDSQRSSLVSNGSGSTTDTTQSSFGVGRQPSLPLPPSSSPEPPPVPPPPALELRLADDPPLDNSRPSNITRPPVLPPTALDESLPRPPERPPKKANLRSLFPSQKDLGGTSGASINGEDLSKPGRPYYYRRPPAPDPPATPDEPPTPEGCPFPPAVSESPSLVPDSHLNGDLHNSSSVLSSSAHRYQRGAFSHPASLAPCSLSLPTISQGNAPVAPLSPTIQALASQASRSSTPDLPPPPPPLPQVEPEASVTVDGEPLPPPPTEVIRSNSRKIPRSSEPPRSLDDLSYSIKSNAAAEEASGPPSLILFTEKTPLPPASEAIDTTKTFRRRSRSPPPPPAPTTPPPPLTEVDESIQREQEDDGTYHKDSYMAQKKDWTSGFEGRYRRTSSPSASPIRNSLPRGPNHPNAHSQPHHLTHHSSTKCLNTYNNSANNNNYSALSATAMLSSSTMALTSYPSNASSSGSSSLSSSLSSSSSKSKSGSHLKHSISSTSSSSSSSAGSATATPRQPMYNPRLKSIPLDNENVNNSRVKPAPLDNENHVNNNSSSPNGWPGHARQTSTTVNFTSEELRAFRSRRAAGEGYFQANYRTLPSAVSTPALVQPSSYNSQTTSSNQGSSSSLASATIDTPPKTSPSSSLRASLDSLHCPRGPVSSRPRGSHEVLPRTTSVNENISSGHDSMSRCMSAADSLSRSTSVADSLCRSSSVAETASSLSRTSSISESTAPSPTSLASGVHSADGPVIARPATVTEEQPMLPSSPEPRYDDHFEYSQTHTLSHDTHSLTQSNLVEEPTFVAQSPDAVSSTQPLTSIHDQSCASPALYLEPVATPDAITDSEVESEDPLGLLNPQELQPSSLCNTSTSSTNSIADTPQSPPALPSEPPPPLDLPPPSPTVSDVDTVTIGYGRSRRPEELECEQLSMEYVARLGLDPRLQALLAPGPELKTTADYMEGVFTYKVRRDILASRAQHLLPKSPPISAADYHVSGTSFLPPSGHSRLDSSNSSYSRVRETDAILHRLHSVPHLSPHHSDSTNNLINSTTSLSNRYTSTTTNSSSSSPHQHDTLTSLTNSSCSPPNASIRPASPRLSRSSSYLGASPVHLSSANQVANFTSLASPLRTEDGKSASSHFFASRSLSMGPEHPSAFGSSLSSLVVAEGLTNGDAGNHNLTNGEASSSSDVLRRKTSDRSPLPSDSAYFTSEGKARILTRLRSSPGDMGDNSGGSPPASPGQADSQQTLLCKKEALMSSIGRKLEILRAEREAIKEEVRLNQALGDGVTAQVRGVAKTQELDKYLRHVEEIDKITSLLLGLSGRLARADNALLLLSDQDGQELRKNLVIKRERLKEQLDEAKTLKENIDRRALQVDKSLKQYLNEADFADYDHFIKMKAKLVMDSREIADKIKLGEEQMAALRETFKSAEDASANK